MTSEPKVLLSLRRGTSSEAEIKAILNNFSITRAPQSGMQDISEATLYLVVYSVSERSDNINENRSF